MRIAMAVHGRFHAFDLARELLCLGHDVLLLTNYPGSVAEKFGVPRRAVRSFVRHGVASRVLGRIESVAGRRFFESSLHRAFGRWAAAELKRSAPWDVIHSFSGIAEEQFSPRWRVPALHALMRGSAHIREQDRILAEEEARAGVRVDRPSAWMIAREEREYALAERIFVLSSFARRTFVRWGIPEEKLTVLPLGAELSRFRASAGQQESRRRRILSGSRLRVLTVGTFSYQKGAYDYQRTADLCADRLDFRFIGSVPRESRRLASRTRAEFGGFKRQFDLPAEYAAADVFFFPTLQDGFAVVLAQALAAGLPILTTSHCAGPDLVSEGRSGWIAEPRDHAAFAARLGRCDAFREETAAAAANASEAFRARDWRDVAGDFVAAVGASGGRP